MLIFKIISLDGSYFYVNCTFLIYFMLDMTKILKFGAGYNLSQNAEDIYSSLNILDGEVPNSVFDFAETASPYLNTTSYLLTSDMHTLDTHSQDGQNSNPSNKNKAPRRKSTFFKIEEVTALVYAILNHGTGRWKMIKDEAFGNDSRHMPTDLKDKWKNLVKTADLPAYKRRGVALPEWLLDMVRLYVYQNGM